MQKKILVPLDGSEFSRQILPQIIENFDPAESKIYLLRVADLPVAHMGMPPRPVAMELLNTTYYETAHDAVLAAHPIFSDQETESLYGELVTSLSADIHQLEDAGFEVETKIRFGDPGTEIIALVEGAKINVLAMTTHGRTGLMRLIFGSVAEKVLRTLTIPVLLLRPT